MPKMAQTKQSIAKEILQRIRRSGPGAIFVPTSFLDLGNRRLVDIVLHRLARRGLIRRLSRGLYDYPKTDPLLGKLSPSIEEIAAALARKDQIRLLPSGAYAANLLRLSEQVPMKAIFLTDGASRRLRIGKQEIILKRTTPRNMAMAGKTIGLLIQALRYLGKENVTTARLAHLRTMLTEKDRKELIQYFRFAPAWMHPFLLEIAEGEKRQ